MYTLNIEVDKGQTKDTKTSRQKFKMFDTKANTHMNIYISE